MTVLLKNPGSQPSVPGLSGGQGACPACLVRCKNYHCPIDPATQRAAVKFRRVIHTTRGLSSSENLTTAKRLLPPCERRKNVEGNLEGVSPPVTKASGAASARRLR